MEPKHSRLPDLMGRRRGWSAALSRSQAEPRLGQGEMPLLPTLTRAPARILLVDDHEEVRELLIVVLRAEGCVVDAAGNGSEALRCLERGRYDLVVSDLKMPELDGPGLYRAVLRRWPNDHPPFLFVSGFADTPHYAGFLNGVHVPVLFKPFDADHLRATVRRVLEEHEAHPCRG